MEGWRSYINVPIVHLWNCINVPLEVQCMEELHQCTFGGTVYGGATSMYLLYIYGTASMYIGTYGGIGLESSRC